MANILVLYYAATYPLRATTRDHLNSYRKYSGHRCYYLNVAFRSVPRYLTKVHFDLVVFDYLLLDARWDRKRFINILKKLKVLKGMQTTKIALPQDEFINTDLLCDFINEFRVSYVFSVAPESEWPAIYPTVDFQKVRFFRVLTGYLDEDTVARIDKLANTIRERPIDIGYRSGTVQPSWGRHNWIKRQLASLLREKALRRGLVIDVKVGSKSFFLGDDWYRFLLRCKYTLSVEGGASILDRDGTIRKRVQEYLAEHPEAGFEEVEAACFPKLDGTLRLFALSPKHLEACATRTCQILVEGEYNGVLVPGQHYIELKRDFSNIDEVLDIVEEDRLRQEITQRAYRDIVASEKYTYRRFVEFVLNKSLVTSGGQQYRSFRSRIWDTSIYHWMRLTDTLSWIPVILWVIVRSAARRILPDRVLKVLRSARRRA